jgi:L-2,4-diaminobutyric acid acetyltransferase
MIFIQAGDSVIYRSPTTVDARAVWHLAKDSGRLDPNSSYCYLVLFQYFADTCLIAERDGQVLGFVTSFVPPGDNESLFVWQIAVAPEAQGQGIGTKLLQKLLEMPSGRSTKRLEATVSPGNEPSRRLFESLARKRGTTCELVPGGFLAEVFPEPGHEDEPLIRIELIEKSSSKRIQGRNYCDKQRLGSNR